MFLANCPIKAILGLIDGIFLGWLGHSWACTLFIFLSGDKLVSIQGEEKEWVSKHDALVL